MSIRRPHPWLASSRYLRGCDEMDGASGATGAHNNTDEVDVGSLAGDMRRKRAPVGRA